MPAKYVTIEAHRVSIQMPEGLTPDEEGQINLALDELDVRDVLVGRLEDALNRRPVLRRLRVVSEQVE